MVKRFYFRVEKNLFLGIKMKVFLFLDYDGTLVSFKPRPEQAKPSKKLLKLLKKLCAKKNFVVSVVSGRTMKELKGFLPIKNLVFASNHGTEISFPSKKEFVFSCFRKKKEVSCIVYNKAV